MVTSERVTVSGLEIAYRRAGTGPPLVLLHGIGGNAGQWRSQLDGLSDEFTVVAWDAPGYGDSTDPSGSWRIDDYADHLAGLIDALGIDRAHLLGQSWGGIIAQTFYRRHAERVRSLMLANTHPGGGARSPEQREASLQARLRALETMTPAEMARARAPVLLAPNPDSALLREVEQMLGRIHPTGYRLAAYASAWADERETLPRISVPTLVIAGELDQVTPAAETQYLADHIPGARLVVIEDTAHLTNQEQPEAFNAIVRRFLQAAQSAGGSS